MKQKQNKSNGLTWESRFPVRPKLLSLIDILGEVCLQSHSRPPSSHKKNKCFVSLIPTYHIPDVRFISNAFQYNLNNYNAILEYACQRPLLTKSNNFHLLQRLDELRLNSFIVPARVCSSHSMMLKLSLRPGSLLLRWVIQFFYSKSDEFDYQFVVFYFLFPK